MTKKAKHHESNVKPIDPAAEAAPTEAGEPVAAESAAESAAKPAAEPAVEPAVEPVPAAEVKEPAYTVEQLTDHLQRLAAEFENYKKRSAREMNGAHDAGVAQALEALLPVLDSFDQALAKADESVNQIWRDGLERIHRQMRDALEKLGLQTVRPEKGELLDPLVHEALMALPTTEVAAGCVVSVWLVGYKYKDRLLRPAKVQVAIEPPVPATGEQEGQA